MQFLLPFLDKEKTEEAKPVTVEEFLVVEPEIIDNEPLFEDVGFDEEGQKKLFTAVLQQAINDYLKESTIDEISTEDIDKAGIELLEHCRRFYPKNETPKQLTKYLKSLPEYSAASWFHSRYNGPYSYIWICNQFSPPIDPVCLLETIDAMPRNGNGLTLNTKKLYIRSSSDPAKKRRRRRRKVTSDAENDGGAETDKADIQKAPGIGVHC